jgi:hypothetical protein
VLSHLAGVATDEQLMAGVATEYGGPITVARPGTVCEVVGTGTLMGAAVGTSA